MKITQTELKDIMSKFQAKWTMEDIMKNYPYSKPTLKKAIMDNLPGTIRQRNKIWDKYVEYCRAVGHTKRINYDYFSK